jgi:hypothetical protein
MASSVTLWQQGWPWRMTTAGNAAEQARGNELRPGVTGIVLSGNGDGFLRPAATVWEGSVT